MTAPFLEMSFRHGRPFAAYLHCAPAQVARSSEMIGAGLVLDRAADGSVLGVEILDPRHADVAVITASLAQHGIAIMPADLAPLAA